jgi:hypothetical protein
MARDRKDKKTVDLMARLELGESLDPDWNIPSEFPDLTQYKTVAVDLETRDPNIQKLGPGWARDDGNIVGIARMDTTSIPR